MCLYSLWFTLSFCYTVVIMMHIEGHRCPTGRS